MHEEVISEGRIAGAILGRLFPPLDLAAEDLYARVNAGERVNGEYVPSSLGFETGVLDHVLVEAFKACVPTVKTFLTAGGLTLIAEWIRHRATAAEVQRRMQELESTKRELQAFRESLERLVELVVRHGVAGDRQLAEAKIVQIIAQAPERAQGREDDDF